MRVAEATELLDGTTRYIIEYEREGQGTQRPTFTFPSDKPWEECKEEMRVAIEEQELLNAPEPEVAVELDHLIGEEL